MDKFILGRYIPGNSFVHRMDARAKLFCSFYFIGIIFLCNNWQSFVLMGLFTLGAIALSKVSFSFFLKGLRPLLLLIVFTVLLQVLFSVGGTVYFHWGVINITSTGVANAVTIMVRFILIIFMSTLLTLTTTPLSLSDAIEYLLQPLKVFRFPAHEVALMLSIALRFVPTLMDETEKIMNAQRARGVDFSEGSILQRLKAVVPLLIPLFVSAFNRADELAIAMEARGYQGGDGRTKYRILKWEKDDTLSVIAMVLLTVALIFLRN